MLNESEIQIAITIINKNMMTKRKLELRMHLPFHQQQSKFVNLSFCKITSISGAN